MDKNLSDKSGRYDLAVRDKKPEEIDFSKLNKELNHYADLLGLQRINQNYRKALGYVEIVSSYIRIIHEKGGFVDGFDLRELDIEKAFSETMRYAEQGRSYMAFRASQKALRLCRSLPNSGEGYIDDVIKELTEIKDSAQNDLDSVFDEWNHDYVLCLQNKIDMAAVSGQKEKAEIIKKEALLYMQDLDSYANFIRHRGDKTEMNRFAYVLQMYWEWLGIQKDIAIEECTEAHEIEEKRKNVKSLLMEFSNKVN